MKYEYGKLKRHIVNTNNLKYKTKIKYDKIKYEIIKIQKQF